MNEPEKISISERVPRAIWAEIRSIAIRDNVKTELVLEALLRYALKDSIWESTRDWTPVQSKGGPRP